MRQTLAALTAMRIRFPGKTEEEAEAVLDEVSALFIQGVFLMCIEMIQILRQKQTVTKYCEKKT